MDALQHRRRDPELMDDPGLDASHHEEALEGLARLNWVSGSVRLVWRPIVQLARQRRIEHLRVLDIATGSGDIPLGLLSRAKRSGLHLEILGLDISERAIAKAQQRTAASKPAVQFQVIDLLNNELPEGYDVVICSLFLHHLEDSQAIHLLKKMRQTARQLGLVNDLVRSRINLWLVQLAARFISRSHVVHTDGALSVRAAFTPTELADIAARAGIENATITRSWPCRMLLQWNTTL